MKQVTIKKGQPILEEIPAPCAENGQVLVQVEYSCISPRIGLNEMHDGTNPFWKKALKNPHKVKNFINMMMSQGLKKTKNLIERQAPLENSTGYSAAGVIIQIGRGVKNFCVGDRVACTGAQYSYHAEVVAVPCNATIPIPKNVSTAHASTVAMGSVAIQGVRRMRPIIGETFVVVGLGFLGQLTSQILQLNGCHVVGIDVDGKRSEIIEKLEIQDELKGSTAEETNQLTDGHGADGIIITATPSQTVVSEALHLCRRKGRVILMEDIDLNLNRADLYQKELNFFTSTSRGQERYDPIYEERGIDYPIPYIRWTENRNMRTYLDLIAQEKLHLDPLITKIYPVDQAEKAYTALQACTPKPLGVLLSYSSPQLSHTIVTPCIQYKEGTHIEVAVVGTRNFTQGIHLSNLEKLQDQFQIKAIVSHSGHNAATMAKQFNAPIASTSFDEMVTNAEIDAFIITTHHDLHHNMILKALKAGKHVLVEKPLCRNQKELEKIKAYFSENNSTPLLLTGFNRRFSPFIQKIKTYIKGPIIINYCINIGHVPQKHWPQQEEEERDNIGEACHIYDLFTYLTGSKVSQIHAQTIHPHSNQYHTNDNFVTTMQFEEGSLATLTYTTLGSKEYSKERMEVYTNGKVCVLEDYKKLSLCGVKGGGATTQLPNKGWKEELVAFGKAILSRDGWPIPLWQQIQAMEISFATEEQLSNPS